MENKIITTDMGLFNKDNAQWLYENGFITNYGKIIGTSDIYPVNAWSLLLELKEDVLKRIDRPSGVYITTEDIITLLRTGKLEKEYSYQGRELKWGKTQEALSNREQILREYQFIRAKVEEESRRKLDAIKGKIKKREMKEL